MLHTGPQRTLQAAVLAVRQLRIAKGLDPNSPNTGTYAAARAKIDVAVPLSLLQTVAKNAEQNVPRGMLLCGEHVTLMDGSTDSMPDTPENQERYPQPKSQEAGLGFPLRRFVVTNLMDAERHPSDAIREMYRSRWHVETDLRTIKTFMSLDILRGLCHQRNNKVPDMVDREFAMGLLAYNLVRAKMLETAMKTREEAPRQLKATKHQAPQTTTTKTKTTASTSTKTKAPTKKPKTNQIAPENVTARHFEFFRRDEEYRDFVLDDPFYERPHAPCLPQRCTNGSSGEGLAQK